MRLQRVTVGKTVALRERIVLFAREVLVESHDARRGGRGAVKVASDRRRLWFQSSVKGHAGRKAVQGYSRQVSTSKKVWLLHN